MKIFVYGFVWKSTKQLRSTSKQRKILHLELCILQVILHNLHRFLLVVGFGQCTTSVGLSRLFTHARYLQTSSFRGSSSWIRWIHFVGDLTAQNWIGAKISLSISISISMRCRNIFWYQRFVLHGIRYNDSNMSARSTPPMLFCIVE